MSVDRLGLRLPPDVGPRVRFVGREKCLVLGEAQTRLTLRTLDGSLHVGRITSPYGELSLTGPETAVTDLAVALSEVYALALPRASLAAEAIALAVGGTPPPRRIGTLALAAGLSVGESFCLVVAHLTDVMLHWSRALSTPGQDPEPVHQMRVAVRRLRSAIGIFRDACASPQVFSVGEKLHDLGRILGSARDWDVFLGGLGATVAAAFAEERSLDRLLHAGARRRAAAYERLADCLSSAQFRRLTIELAAIAVGTGWQENLDESQRAGLPLPIEAFAASILTRRLRRVMRRGEDFGELDQAGLHAVRLAAKRLRYAAEFFASLFVQKSAEPFIRTLTLLQDRLGYINDASVAASLLAELGPTGGACGFAIGVVRGFVTAESTHGRKRLIRAWKQFRKQSPFWG